MNKEFVSYQQAVALSELKYDGDYNYTYTIDKHLWYGNVKADGISSLAAPLKQQVFRWFREKYECYCDIWQYQDDLSFAFGVKIKFNRYDAEVGFKTYEEAENACLDKLIELTKNL